MMRSLGAATPAIDKSVVNQSVMWTISLLLTSAAILPGQRAMHGVRSEPSIPVK
jgi:hypothetical protein